MCLMETVYKDGKKTPIPRQVKSFGNYEKLVSEHPEKLAELQRLYGNKEEAAKAQRQAGLDLFVNAGKVPDNVGKKMPVLGLAALLLNRLWDHELMMGTFVSYLLRHEKTQLEYRPADIAYYYTICKLINPMSHFSGHRESERLLGNPLDDTSLQDVYRCLAWLYKHKNPILRHVNRRLGRLHERRLDLLFYDCTNCYFETPFDDAYWYQKKAMRLLRRQLRKELPQYAAMSDGQLDETIRNDTALTEQLNCILEDLGTPFRMRGHSKEKRTDLPLVSIALVIDENGIPFDFEIYPGNSNEQATMENSVDSLKLKHKIRNCIMVADNGLNGTGNLQMLMDHGMGFSVAQSPRQLSKGDRKRHLVDKSQMKPLLDEAGAPTGVYYSISPITRRGRVTDDKGNKRRVKVECSLMMTYSDERRQRDLDVLDTLVAKRKAAGKPLSAQTEQKHRDCAGYAGVLFKQPPDMEEGALSAEYIAGLYQRLVRIEECFRIMKSEFDLRPMHVYTQPSVGGHVLICILALMIMRLLQLKLAQKKISMSPEQISKTLKEAEVAVANTSLGYTLLNLGRIHAQEDTKGRNRDIAPDPVDRLMLALDQEPLPASSTLADIRNKFGLRSLKLTELQIKWIKEHSPDEISPSIKSEYFTFPLKCGGQNRS